SSSPSWTKRRSAPIFAWSNALWVISRSSGSSSATRTVSGVAGAVMRASPPVTKKNGNVASSSPTATDSSFLLRSFCQGEHDDERRPLPHDAVRRDGPPVPLGDLLADGQPDARALVLASAVQALEDLEDAQAVFGVEADPVVADADAAGRLAARVRGHDLG